jgi:hypothetical protein
MPQQKRNAELVRLHCPDIRKCVGLGQKVCQWNPEPTRVQGAYPFYCIPEDPFDDFDAYDEDGIQFDDDTYCFGHVVELDAGGANVLAGYGESAAGLSDPFSCGARLGFMTTPREATARVAVAVFEDVSDPTGSELHTIGLITSATGVLISVDSWTNYNTLNVNLATQEAGHDAEIWAVIVSDFSGDLHFLYSNDGIHFIKLADATPTAAPLNGGWVYSNGTTQDPTRMTIQWYQQDDAEFNSWLPLNYGFAQDNFISFQNQNC